MTQYKQNPSLDAGLLLAQCLRAGFARPALAALLCALADETIQLFVPGRSGQVKDIWIDFAGAVLAIGLTVLARMLLRRARANAGNTEA